MQRYVLLINPFVLLGCAWALAMAHSLFLPACADTSCKKYFAAHKADAAALAHIGTLCSDSAAGMHREQEALCAAYKNLSDMP